MELLALPGEDGRVDGLGQQRMAEPEAARLRHGDEDAVLDRLAERLPQLLLGQTRGRVQQGIAGIAAGGRGQAQHALGRAVEVSDALQEEIAQAPRSSPPRSPAAARSCSAKKGLPSERATMVAVRSPVTEPPARATSSLASSSRPSGPSSSRIADPERRTPSARRRTRSAEGVQRSAARTVPSSRIGRSPRLWARKATRSSVDVSAQCRSSRTSSRGRAAARSVRSASVASNTRSCEPSGVAPAFRGSPSGRRASTSGW